MYRYCEKAGLAEVSDLKYGMDFRKPEYRRETFLRFYEFHLKYRAHPGCVYSILPFLFEREKMDMEQKLWFCFLNGNTQHALTSYVIFHHFPDLRKIDLAELESWIVWWYPNLQFDTDRRHHKALIVESVREYKKLLAGRTQEEYFKELLTGRGFSEVFKIVQRDFYTFGRLSAYSYLEYLRIAGLPVHCSSLFLRDIEGSKSHRNGLCKVLGRDDLDWHKSNPAFDGKYTDELLDWLEQESFCLLGEAIDRFSLLTTVDGFFPDVNYFTLESALCTYKSWHRPNRRYPGCYLDMFKNRMDFYAPRLAKLPKLMEPFNEWRMTVPVHLRTECNPGDPGLKPEKQNHYLKTGQPIMMDRDWPCFKNDYNDRINAIGTLF